MTRQDSSVPFQTWRAKGKTFLAARGGDGFTICDDAGDYYGAWQSVAYFRQRYANGDPSLAIGAGAVVSVRGDAARRASYMERAQYAARQLPRFDALSFPDQSAILDHIYFHASQWDRDGLSVEEASERAVREVLDRRVQSVAGGVASAPGSNEVMSKQ